MPPKPTCFTKERNDKSLYTTCVEGQKKPKKQKLKIVEAKPKKKKLKIVEPKPKKQKLIIKKKEPKVSEAQKKKDAMNKLSPLELFGMLPQELKKKILTPKETGIKVGVIPVSSFTYDDIVEPKDDNKNLVYEAEENFEESGGGGGATDIAWIKGITSKQAEFYKYNIRSYSDLSEKQQNRIETIEEKIREGLRPTIKRDFKKELKEWKVKNKDKKMNLKEAVKSFKRSSQFFSDYD